MLGAVRVSAVCLLHHIVVIRILPLTPQSGLLLSGGRDGAHRLSVWNLRQHGGTLDGRLLGGVPLLPSRVDRLCRLL